MGLLISKAFDVMRLKVVNLIPKADHAQTSSSSAPKQMNVGFVTDDEGFCILAWYSLSVAENTWIWSGAAARILVEDFDQASVVASPNMSGDNLIARTTTEDTASVTTMPVEESAATRAPSGLVTEWSAAECAC